MNTLIDWGFMGLYGIGAALFLAIVPIGMWRSREHEARMAWLPRQTGTEPAGEGQYREARTPTFEQAGPPLVVKVAALGAWGLGQFFVPGLLIGCLGLVVGLGLATIPGLILSARLFLLGAPLVRGELAAAVKARDAARFAWILNTIIVVATLGGMIARLTLGSGEDRWLQSLGIGLPVLIYAGISIAHGALLRRAATEIEMNHAAWLEAASVGLRVEPDGPSVAVVPTPAPLADESLVADDNVLARPAAPADPVGAT
jgi:hypothetical protein